MKYLEYMINHEDENLSWCKPFIDKSVDYCLIIYEGHAECINIKGAAYRRGVDHDFDEKLEELARAVNPDYALYRGWSVEHMAIEAMREVGCSSCPFRDECEAMGEEMAESDYR